MNPYLEVPDVWSDFHGSFLIELRGQLNDALPTGYVARWDRYVWVDDDENERMVGRPDVFITEAPFSPPANGGTATLAAPLSVVLPAPEPEGKPYVKIIDSRRKRVVTVVEMLSPANKARGIHHDAYLAKRQEYLRTGTNLVEIDFLRGGQRPPVEGVPGRYDYCILVSRAAEFPQAGFWPLTIREPLPTIPIPLDPGMAEISVSLQACFAPVFARGRYEEDIDYTQAAPPPVLDEADATWVKEQILLHRQ